MKHFEAIVLLHRTRPPLEYGIRRRIQCLWARPRDVGGAVMYRATKTGRTVRAASHCVVALRYQFEAGWRCFHARRRARSLREPLDQAT